MKKKNRDSFWFDLPDLGKVEFPPFVLEHFEKHQQKRVWHKEAGGQLFWEYMPNGRKRVGAITGPRPTDRRTRMTYKADPTVEQAEIDENYKKGLFFLGDWHTHPEPVASPSSQDVDAIREIYQSSSNPGPGFLLAIVGTKPLEDGLSISWCNENVVPVTAMRK